MGNCSFGIRKNKKKDERIGENFIEFDSCGYSTNVKNRPWKYGIGDKICLSPVEHEQFENPSNPNIVRVGDTIEYKLFFDEYLSDGLGIMGDDVEEIEDIQKKRVYKVPFFHAQAKVLGKSSVQGCYASHGSSFIFIDKKTEKVFFDLRDTVKCLTQWNMESREKEFLESVYPGFNERNRRLKRNLSDLQLCMRGGRKQMCLCQKVGGTLAKTVLKGDRIRLCMYPTRIDLTAGKCTECEEEHLEMQMIHPYALCLEHNIPFGFDVIMWKVGHRPGFHHSPLDTPLSKTDIVIFTHRERW